MLVYVRPFAGEGARAPSLRFLDAGEGDRAPSLRFLDAGEGARAPSLRLRLTLANHAPQDGKAVKPLGSLKHDAERRLNKGFVNLSAITHRGLI